MAKTPTVCEHLHLPLQSGSDRILRAMRRSYRAARYLRLVERTRELMPNAALTTDIIVGFPGETDEDFADTLRVVDAVGFDQAFTFQYSPRPGTPAAEMTDKFVPNEVVAERYPRLEQLVRAQSLAAHERLVGEVVELLVEEPSKRDVSRVSARTRGNHLVHLPAGPGIGAGAIVEAQVVEAATNYAVAAAPTAVRRPADFPTPPVRSRPSLPVLSA
jgi:tRNA-2-methylthio-N6-dimethylallyladenosine synthase